MYSLFVVIGLCAVACKTADKKHTPWQEEISFLYDSALRPFYHGIASGDPLADRVILWTRVTPNDSLAKISVQWEVASDSLFNSIISRDTVETNPSKNYTVKVDVTALQPDTYYYYRFKALGGVSRVGRTKTLPVQSVDSLTFAAVSCSNWEGGYFNAYEKIANRPEIDVVLHLGDYIYEYERGRYGDSTIRKNYPKHEIVSLQDYRTRHALYRLDQGLQKMTACHTLVAIWDDHEVANNVYVQGAENHQPDEGDFIVRKNAARKAYYEWMPIRESEKHYRSMRFGNLAELIMLDERLEGRSRQPSSVSDSLYQSKNQSMLGPEQLNWFMNTLKNSSSTWKIIGNQVIFSDVELSSVYPKMPRNLDAWDGYPVEKKKITDVIVTNKINNIVFLTGDTHASWAIEAATNVSKTYTPFAIELGTTSVSSPNEDEYKSADTVKLMEQRLLQKNPHIKYLNGRDHGYLLLTLKPEGARAYWYYVNTVREPVSVETLGKSFKIKRGSASLKN
jgi:alkaline phosphatase D